MDIQPRAEPTLLVNHHVMRYLLLLACVLGTPFLHAQTYERESAYLKGELESGEIDITTFRKLAKELRETIDELGGYPEVSLGPDGAFVQQTRIETSLTREQNWDHLHRWFASASLTTTTNLGYANADAGIMVLPLASQYTYTRSGRVPIDDTGYRSAAPFSVRWIMTVEVQDSLILVRWEEPELEEHLLRSYYLGEGGGMSGEFILVPFRGLLPIVAGETDRWRIRLRRANLINKTLSTAEANLQRYFGQQSLLMNADQ